MAVLAKVINKFGQDIFIGTHVTYPRVTYSGVKMIPGIVTKIVSKLDRSGGSNYVVLEIQTDRRSKLVVIRKTENLVKI